MRDVPRSRLTATTRNQTQLSSIDDAAAKMKSQVKIGGVGKCSGPRLLFYKSKYEHFYDLNMDYYIYIYYIQFFERIL